MIIFVVVDFLCHQIRFDGNLSSDIMIVCQIVIHEHDKSLETKIFMSPKLAT